MNKVFRDDISYVFRVLFAHFLIDGIDHPFKSHSLSSWLVWIALSAFLRSRAVVLMAGSELRSLMTPSRDLLISSLKRYTREERFDSTNNLTTLPNTCKQMNPYIVTLFPEFSCNIDHVCCLYNWQTYYDKTRKNDHTVSHLGVLSSLIINIFYEISKSWFLVTKFLF